MLLPQCWTPESSTHRTNLDDLATLTLADYLQGEGSEYHRLRQIPRVSKTNQMNGIASGLPISMCKDSLDSLDANSVNKLMTSSDEVSESGLTVPGSNDDPMDYLYKRRQFIRTVLIERYAELVKLMHEEMDLTGFPPEQYHQYLHEYRALLAAIRPNPSCTSKQAEKVVESTTVEKETQSTVRTPDQNAASQSASSCLPLADKPLGTRLQQTEFTISASTVRRATLAHSCSSNSLLHVGGQSTPPIDSRFKLTNAASQRPLSKTSLLSVPLIKATTMQASEEKKCRARDSRTSSFSNVVHRELQSISLTDLCAAPITTHRTLSKEVDRKGSETQLADSSPEPLIQESECGFQLAAEQDREQAIAVIDMELAALRNILEANTRCAKEMWRKKTSKKSYQLAAMQNQQAITQLEEKRKNILKEKLLGQEVKSIDSFRTTISLEGTELSSTKNGEEASQSSISVSSQEVNPADLKFPSDTKHPVDADDSASVCSGVYDGLVWAKSKSTLKEAEQPASPSSISTQGVLPAVNSELKSSTANAGQDLNELGKFDREIKNSSLPVSVLQLERTQWPIRHAPPMGERDEFTPNPSHSPKVMSHNVACGLTAKRRPIESFTPRNRNSSYNANNSSSLASKLQPRDRVSVRRDMNYCENSYPPERSANSVASSALSRQSDRRSVGHVDMDELYPDHGHRIIPIQYLPRKSASNDSSPVLRSVSPYPRQNYQLHSESRSDLTSAKRGSSCTREQHFFPRVIKCSIETSGSSERGSTISSGGSQPHLRPSVTIMQSQSQADVLPTKDLNTTVLLNAVRNKPDYQPIKHKTEKQYLLNSCTSMHVMGTHLISPAATSYVYKPHDLELNESRI